MKQITKYLAIALIVIGNSSFKKLSISDNNVSIYQDGKETVVKNNDEVLIRKDKFAVRFSNKAYNSSAEKYYAAQVAAFIDKSELHKINIGMETTEISCFEPGTGMASYSFGYDALIFNKSGHHYLYFETKSDKRVNLISEKKGILRLEFPIEKFMINKEYFKISDVKMNEFYLAIFIDSNLNSIIDEGELTKLTIKFL